MRVKLGPRVAYRRSRKPMTTPLTLLTVALLSGPGATQRSTPDRSVVPQCATSTDERYGLAVATPVQVGGGAMYGPARERRYLEALRGPEGQVVRYRRTGSLPAPDGNTILDAYETIYDGLEKPITIYVDEYHFTDPMAPRGFTCGQPISLGPPPTDPFFASRALLTTAIEQGASRDFQPIALDGDGSTTHGVVFDHFRLVARAARAAAQSGVTLNSQTLPPAVAQPRTVVLAYPLTCGGRTVAPVSIDILSTRGAAPSRDGDYARDAGLGTLLPGVQAPASSLAATFVISTLRPIDTVQVGYADATCTGGDPQAVFPVKFSAGRPIDMPPPTYPSGATPGEAPLRLQVLVDFDGMLQHPVYIGGPPDLSNAAMEAIRHWRFEPQRINGAPIAGAAIVQVTFKK
jgi:hypothetical protein